MAITYEQVLGALNEIDKETAQLIMPREGFSSSVYPDKDREETVTGFAAGFGHKLTDEELKQYKVGDEIPHKQAVDWLRADLERTRKASQEQASQIPNVTKEFQESLQKVNYQLGTGWTQKFPTAWEHMKAGRWDQAIEEIKFTEEGSGQESKWMKQTPKRAEDFIQAIQEQWEAAKVPSSPEYTEKMEKWWEVDFDLLEHRADPEEGSKKLKKLVENNTPKITAEESIERLKVKIADLMAMSDETFDFIGEAEAGDDEELAGRFPLLEATHSLPLPVWAFKEYLTDSAQAHFKSILGGKSADSYRTFEPSKRFTQEHYDALDNFIITNQKDAKKNKPVNGIPSRKPGWSSININAPKYKNLRDKDPALWDMAKTVGTVDFYIDPLTDKITYSDQYDFSKKFPIIGPSKGPTDEFTNPRIPGQKKLTLKQIK